MSQLDFLTEAEVHQFAIDWYRKLDVHAPIENYIPLFAEERLEMQFPEGTFKGFEGFKSWYESVTGIFFDEVHTLKKVQLITVSEEKANVKIVVGWEASIWNPPAAKSERVVLDAYQTWVVKRSSKTKKPVILTYIVDSMKYAEGSAKL